MCSNLLGHIESERFESLPSREFPICRSLNFYVLLDMTPHVVSGIKNLRLLKSSQATFAGFYRNEYTTLKDNYERLLRLALETLEKILHD